MASNAEKDRIKKMIGAINKASAGDDSTTLDVSPAKDEMDLLANAINILLKKTGKQAPAQTRDGAGQDVTDERYRNMLESMQEAYFETDLKGNMLFYNDRVTEVLGYSPEEVSDMSFKQLVNEADAKKLYETFSHVYLTGEAIRGFEWQVLKKNGKIIDVKSSIALLRNLNGKPRGFLGVVRNITKRKQAETKLRQSEERYRNILNSIEESYLELDLKGNLLFFNHAVMDELGYTSEELTGMNYRRIVGQENEKTVYEKFHTVFLTGEPVKDYAWQVIKKDGSIIDVESSIALLRDENGKPYGFRSVERDITSRRQIEAELTRSEERYRTILDIMGEAYLEHDLRGNIIFANDPAGKLLELDRDKLIGMNYRDYLSPEAAQNISDIFHRVYETGQPALLIDYDVLRKDGTTKTYQMNVALVQDEPGKPSGFRVLTWDVTERKKAELDLRESEKRYRMIADNIHDTIWTMDFNLQYTYLSPSVEPLTGYPPEELKKIPLNKQLTPASLALVERILAEEFAAEDSRQPRDPHASRNMELEIIRKDGATLWEEVTVTFNRDENGKPFEILGVTRDVSERKKSEAIIQHSEKRYRMIAENMNDIIWTLGLDLQLTYVSPSCTRVTGYTPEETRQTHLDKLLTPESFTKATKRLADELDLEASGKPFNPQRYILLEVEAWHKEGGTIWLEVTGTFNRDTGGNIAEILVVGKDITARKKMEIALEESEKRYRMIVENMNDTVWTMDLNLQYKFISSGGSILTGFTEEELRTIPLKEQITPESHALMEEIMTEAFALEYSGQPIEPKASRTFEVEAYHKDGGTIWVDINATFDRDENGKPQEIIIAGRNVTERKKMQTEKEILEKQLIQAQKMETVGRLAGGVAHDFNNMLNVILGYIDLTKLKLPTHHPIMHDILEIEKAACRSRDLTAQLLAFSRKQIIQPQAVNLNQLIAETQKAIVRLIGEDVELKFYPGGDLGTIKFDPLQAEQILINLSVNARDAMPKGGKLIIETSNIHVDKTYCETHLDLAPGPYVLLTVSDTGSGIDKDHLPHIFEPFFTTKEIGKGTGLGLATVYGIVKQNNGIISVYSEPRQGSIFKIYLPRSGDAEVSRETTPEPPASPGEGTILLVEDDKMVLKMVADMLEALGYRVIASGSPLSALSQCEECATPIDLVITDVVMPGMSGRELRDKLLLTRPELKVLFMSGYTSNIIAHHGVLEEGMQFIQKPFSMSLLAAKVSKLIPEIKSSR